jgi:hypothetical protein
MVAVGMQPLKPCGASKAWAPMGSTGTGRVQRPAAAGQGMPRTPSAATASLCALRTLHSCLQLPHGQLRVLRGHRDCRMIAA